MGKSRMTDREIRRQFEQDGCMVRGGHFVYAGRKHGSVYINKAVLLCDPRRAQCLSDELGHRLIDKGLDRRTDVVVGPEKGGIKMSHLVAMSLSPPEEEQGTRRVLAVYAEKDGPDRFVLKNGFDLVVRDRNVLIAEDIVNEATTVRSVIRCVMAAGGTVIGVSALWNRGPYRSISIELDPRGRTVEIPIVSLVEEQLDAWHETDCPLCAVGEPLSALGHAGEFLKKKDIV